MPAIEPVILSWTIFISLFIFSEASLVFIGIVVLHVMFDIIFDLMIRDGDLHVELCMTCFPFYSVKLCSTPSLLSDLDGVHVLRARCV